MSDYIDMLILPLLALWAAAFIPLYALDRYQCDSYERATGKTTKYVGLECYVQDKGQWFAWAEYKNRLVAKGAMQ